MKRVPCTWAEAEALFPGIEHEWRSMCGQEGTCIPPANIEVRLELHDWPCGKVLHVIQTDPENEWLQAPEWRRWPSGGWTHPIPMTKKLHESVLFRTPIEYEFTGKRLK